MTSRKITGVSASKGIAMGPVHVIESVKLEIQDRPYLGFDVEMEKFYQAQSKAKIELEELTKSIKKITDKQISKVFEAHIILLTDPTLEDMVRKYVTQGMIVEKSVNQAKKDLYKVFSTMEDKRFAERAFDIQDVCDRVIRILRGEEELKVLDIVDPSIIVAHNLTPSDTAKIVSENVIGIITAIGGITSHMAIFARSIGIPAIVGIGREQIALIKDKKNIILDGNNGVIITNPSKEQYNKFRKIQEKEVERKRQFQSKVYERTQTKDGKRIQVFANVNDLKSVYDANKYGAEGIGLLRTEFLYLEKKERPTPLEQFNSYQKILEANKGKPIIIRTLDIGGDKPLNFLEIQHELNPFLGLRGLRFGLKHVHLLKSQLRAILRAAYGYEKVSIMFPMINSLDEIKRAREILEKAKEELEKEKITYNDRISIGIMIETPASAITIDILSSECDFFSIGTNDLTQYSLAVDRTNENVVQYYQLFHPSILRLIKQIIDFGKKNNKKVGLCGSLAGMTKAIPILLGLGLEEFSMVPQLIPEAKWLISNLTIEDAESIAKKVLNFHQTDEIEHYLQKTLEKIENNI